jgi:quercetin dioxygenase-like cupin family protein
MFVSPCVKKQQCYSTVLMRNTVPKASPRDNELSGTLNSFPHKGENAMSRKLFWRKPMNRLKLKLVIASTMAFCLFVSFQMRLPAQTAKPPATGPSQALAKGDAPANSSASTEQEPITVNQSEVEWQPMAPEMGKYSPMRTVLHEHPVTHSIQFLIRMPPNFHVPAHFHSANETHTVIEGMFIIAVNGKKVELLPGGFNYTPAHMMHEAWTSPKQGALIFVTIDGPYDILQAKLDWGGTMAGQ